MGKVKVVKNKEEKPKKRKRKVAFITISVILAILFSLFLASYILIGSYFCKFSLSIKLFQGKNLKNKVILYLVFSNKLL